MEKLPADEKVLDALACPELLSDTPLAKTVPCPWLQLLPPTRKSTVPAVTGAPGFPPPWDVSVPVAVNVTFCPTEEGFWLELTAVFVPSASVNVVCACDW